MTTAVLDKLTPEADLPAIPFRMRGYDGPTTPAAMTEECRELADARAAIQGPFQRRPADVRTLLWRARALDIPVGVAIDHIYINMQGKAGLSAQLIAALIRRAGVSWTTVKTPDMVQFTFTEKVAYTTRRGRPASRIDVIGVVTFELIEAQAAGIAGTRHWQAWPIACMWARAMARAGRELFSHITMGFAYTPEELHDGTAADAAPTTDVEQILPAVTELLEQALSESATAELIKTDILVRARTKRLLKEDAGDGRTLAQALADVWQQKVAFEEDQQQAVTADRAMTAAGITATPPTADTWKDTPLGDCDVPLPCTCPSAVLITDVHEEGCTGVLPE